MNREMMNAIWSFLLILAVAGCAGTASQTGGRSSPDQLPMYGGLDRQSVPGLKAADDQFIANMVRDFGSREKASQASVEQGIRYYQRDDYVLAMRRFNQAWLLNPRNPDAFWGFAIVYHDKEEIREAKEMIDRALSLDLSKPIALADAGRIYTLYAVFGQPSADATTKRQLFSKSDELFSKADSASPNNDYIYGLWAAAYYWRDDYAQAWQMVQRMRGAGGTPPAAFINMLRAKMPEPK
jgi:tetratricopeptide (TPR) repeat protein